MNSRVMTPFCAWSLRKWYLISMCLLLECCMGLFEMLMALVLSRLIGIGSNDKPKSLSVYFIRRICTQHKPDIMYLAFSVDKVIEFWIFCIGLDTYFSCLIFLSRTFPLYMDIMFSPCAFLFYHFSLSILWQKGRDMRVDYWFIFFIVSIGYDMDWYMLACMSYIKILMILIFFF